MWGCEVRWQQFCWVCMAPLRGADDRPNKASQGLGPSLLALPLPLPFLLPPAPSVCHHTPCGHMWSSPNGTQLDSHLPCRTGRSSTILSEFQCSAPDGTAEGGVGGVCVVSPCHHFSHSIVVPVILTLSPRLVKTCDACDVVKVRTWWEQWD